MNSLQLLLLIILPSILTTFLVGVFFNKGLFRPTEIWKIFSLKSDDGLAKQALFWWSIFTPAMYFMSFGLISWQGYDILISSEGFKKFIEISTLPIALFSLAIPLGVVIARFHSTEQTARQITIAKHKNNLDAFYAHRKEFFAYFDKMGTITFLDTLDVDYNINPKLHGLLFKGSPENGTPELDEELISQVIGKIKFIRTCLNKVLLNSDPELTYTWYTTAANDIYWISLMLGIREINTKINNMSVTLIGYGENGETIRQRSIGKSTVQAICAYRCIKSYILIILHFSGSQSAIEDVYEGEIEYIDKTGGYMHINPTGPVIERNFSGDSGTPWKFED